MTDLAKLRELLDKNCNLFTDSDAHEVAVMVPALLDEVEKLRAALRVSERYLEASCMNVSNPKTRNNYADALRVVRQALGETK